ncbi:hypothetical protein G9A89_020051 [Geosiphon pyriformis]|nr:hypothetical protein G9A89_020051 [Geosiphon pyriformis]
MSFSNFHLGQIKITHNNRCTIYWAFVKSKIDNCQVNEGLTPHVGLEKLKQYNHSQGNLLISNSTLMRLMSLDFFKSRGNMEASPLDGSCAIDFSEPANAIIPYQKLLPDKSHSSSHSIVLSRFFSAKTFNYQNGEHCEYILATINSLTSGDQLESLDCALDLMRRLPPHKTEENLTRLLGLVPNLQDELLNSVDQPLKVQKCKKTGKDYLVCEFNRDGDACRSPWSNEYDPPISEGNYPPPHVRKLEETANFAFDTYREMYYEGGVSSAYFWKDKEDVLAGAILFRKVDEGGDKRKTKGAWDSIHVFRAGERNRIAHYKLTSTVILYTITNKPELGHLNLSGSMMRQFEIDYPIEEPQAHISNIGRIIEDMELKMRNLLQEVYFGKTKDIVNDLRSIDSIIEAKKQDKIRKELVVRAYSFLAEAMQLSCFGYELLVPAKPYNP